jgi:hypothetical protein
MIVWGDFWGDCTKKKGNAIENIHEIDSGDKIVE